MDLEEVRANIGREAVWDPAQASPTFAAVSRPVRVVIRRVIGKNLPGYDGPPRVWVQFVGFSSETDVAPEELTLSDG